MLASLSGFAFNVAIQCGSFVERHLNSRFVQCIGRISETLPCLYSYMQDFPLPHCLLSLLMEKLFISMKYP